MVLLVMFTSSLTKHIPDVLKMVFVPFCTLIIAGAASLIVIGPISIVLQKLIE